MSFYPHGTLVYFGCKKMAARCCRHASPNRTPDWQGVPGAHFFDRPGRLVYVSQIGANFEIHEFINPGWPKWCPRCSPRKRPCLNNKRHFTCTGRLHFLLIFSVGGHRWNAEGAASDFFAVAPGRAEKGSPPIFLEILKFVFGAGNLTTCVGNGISHCTLYCALYCTLYCILYCRDNFCTAGPDSPPGLGPRTSGLGPRA